MLLAVVLSFLAVTLWSSITGRSCFAPPKKPDEDNGKPVEGTENPDDPPAANGEQPKDPPKDPNGNGDVPEPPQDPDGNGDGPEPRKDDPIEDHPHSGLEVERAVLKSTELEVGFTTLGGSVEYVRLLRQFETDKETPLDVIVPADPWHMLGHVDDTALVPSVSPGGADRRDEPAGPMRKLNWRIQSVNEKGIVFFWEANGVRLTKRWTMPVGEDQFALKLTLSGKATSGDAKALDVKVLVSGNQFREEVQGMDMFQGTRAVVRLSNQGEVSEDFHFGIPVEELTLGGVDNPRLRMLGSRSLYYMVAYYREAGEPEPPITRAWITGEDASQRPTMEENVKAFFEQRGRAIEGDSRDEALALRLKRSVAQAHHAWVVVQLPLDEKPVELPIYVGPMSRGVLAQESYRELEPTITFPFSFDIVAKALIGIYDIWLSLFGSAGLAVILMTLVVRGLMMPLSIRNQLSMRKYSRKVAKLKPKLAALQQKFGKNPKKMREEQMKLYREHGIGFPGGCLMMLLQIPIWFALFSSLRREFTLRGASFLWIDDLSGPDKLIELGTNINLMVLQLSSINLLPLLMVTLSIIHTRSMPKPQDEQTAQQYKMMKWMPIIFAVILYNYTAALMLYMVLSSAFGILEAKIVRVKDESAADAAPAPA